MSLTKLSIFCFIFLQSLYVGNVGQLTNSSPVYSLKMTPTHLYAALSQSLQSMDFTSNLCHRDVRWQSLKPSLEASFLWKHLGLGDNAWRMVHGGWCLEDGPWRMMLGGYACGMLFVGWCIFNLKSDAATYQPALIPEDLNRTSTPAWLVFISWTYMLYDMINSLILV